MSGIAGIFSSRDRVDRAELRRFTDALTHRGPTANGFALQGPLGLGHRKLAAFDGDRAREPLGFEDSLPVARELRWRALLAPYRAEDREEMAFTPLRYWITFDGEIANAAEVRRELETMGYPFRTGADAELVLVAYAQWGEACLRRFNGSWAFALWDRKEKSLFLARDRFGERPLYYWQASARFAFASEQKAFLHLYDFRAALNVGIVPAVIEDAEAQHGTSVETLMAGLHRIPSGHALRVVGGVVARMWRWWETREHFPVVPTSYADQVARCKELLVDAVRLRLRRPIRLARWNDGSLASAVVGHLASAVQNDSAYPAQLITLNRTEGVADSPAPARIIADLWNREELDNGNADGCSEIFATVRQDRLSAVLGVHGHLELFGGRATQLDWPMMQVNDFLYRDFHATRLPALLRSLDGAAMAHGLQMRLPLLDHRIVTFVHALPADAKFGGGYVQRVLRDATIGLVPDSERLQRGVEPIDPSQNVCEAELAVLAPQLLQHPRWLETPEWNTTLWREAAAGLVEQKPKLGLSIVERAKFLAALRVVLWEKIFVERMDRTKEVA